MSDKTTIWCLIGIIILCVAYMVCFGCAVSKRVVRVQVTDSPAKPNSETVTATYELELR